jgi:hypothetical protein
MTDTRGEHGMPETTAGEGHPRLSTSGLRAQPA